MTMKSNPALTPLDRALGTWTATGSHPYFPERVLRGRAIFERTEGGAFIRMQSTMEDPEFPEGVAIFGTDDDNGTCTMLYFDSRGVSRRYEVVFHEDGFTWSRESPQFSQSFRVTIARDGSTMESEGKMKKGGGPWEPDLRTSYARAVP
jgi:hypothetical protein